MAPLVDVTNSCREMARQNDTLDSLSRLKSLRASSTTRKLRDEENEHNRSSPGLKSCPGKHQCKVLCKLQQQQLLLQKQQQILVRSIPRTIQIGTDQKSVRSIEQINWNYFDTDNTRSQSSELLSPMQSSDSFISKTILPSAITLSEQYQHIIRYLQPVSKPSLSSQLSQLSSPLTLSNVFESPNSSFSSLPSPPFSPESSPTGPSCPQLSPRDCISHVQLSLDTHGPASSNALSYDTPNRKCSSSVVCLTPPPETQVVMVGRGRSKNNSTTEVFHDDQHACVSCGALFPSTVALSGHLFTHVVEGFQAAQWFMKAFALLQNNQL